MPRASRLRPGFAPPRWPPACCRERRATGGSGYRSWPCPARRLLRALPARCAGRQRLGPPNPPRGKRRWRISRERAARAETDVEVEQLPHADDGATVGQSPCLKLRRELADGFRRRLRGNRSEESAI